MLDRPTIGGRTTPALQRAEGEGRIAAKTRDGRTALDTLYQHGCAKIRLPRSHDGRLQAVLINSSGGLTGGDRMRWSARAGAGARLVVTTQACERVYRSAGGAARVATTLRAESGARLDWLPQETILFDGSALDRTLDVELAEDAAFLGVEAIILGRQAHGDPGFLAAIRDRWSVRRGGRLIHAEAARLDGGDALARDNPALLDGARAYATLLYVAADAERRIEPVKALVAPHEAAGASRIGDKLVVRAMAGSGQHLRRIVTPLVEALSPGGAVPRVWTL